MYEEIFSSFIRLFVIHLFIQQLHLFERASNGVIKCMCGCFRSCFTEIFNYP